MPSVTRVGGWDHAANGIGSLINAIVQAPLARAQAEQEAAFNNARTYAANMQGNLHGANARGEEITNDYRAEPIDPNLPEAMQKLQWLWQRGGGNVDQMASAQQRLHQIGLADAAVANPKLAPSIGLAQAAAAGKPIYNNVGETGAVINPYTGATQIANTQMFGLHQGVEQGKALESTAKANADNALVDLRAQDVLSKVFANGHASINYERAQQGLPPLSAGGAANAAEMRGRAQMIMSVMENPLISEEEKAGAIERYLDVYDKFMGGGRGTAPEQQAAPQPVVAPQDPQGQRVGGKTITSAEVAVRARRHGITPEVAAQMLRAAGYQIR